MRRRLRENEKLDKNLCERNMRRLISVRRLSEATNNNTSGNKKVNFRGINNDTQMSEFVSKKVVSWLDG